MTGNILDNVLSKLNAKLRKDGRNVLLFIDNAGCHLPKFCDKYIKITIAFLPADTTSVLQPLDPGIIKPFKVHYRTSLIRFVLARFDEYAYASKVL
uniref:DDE-1 domain-containing protein n=1 Tax=Amphimedon queenslandica TaxID=400682 RepID=A0A1X7VAJ2_AMPQE